METGNILFGNSRGAVPVERGRRQSVAVWALEAAGFDAYGCIHDERLRRFVDSSHLSAEVPLVRIGDYEVMPYFWGDADAHPDVAAYPNFTDHASGFSVQWYKYPMRDAYANRATDDAEWDSIWTRFADYVGKRLDGIPQIRDDGRI